ncbi:MAG: MCE family protein [Bacteroidia bacterium]|nr:MCE family protein [Bacteroidia bacterium]
MGFKKYKYTIVGFVIIIAIAAFIWGLYFLKGRDVFNKESNFYAIYQKVDGLTISSPILINGFKVGQVINIYFHPDKSGRLIVMFNTKKDIELPDSTVARITSIDLMGNKAIELLLSHYKTFHKDGDTLYSALEPSLKEQVSIQMLPVKKQAENLMMEMQGALEIVKYIFNAQTRDNLTKSFESIKLTVQNLEHSSGNLDTLVTSQATKLSVIFSNVESITANLKNNNALITNIITNLSAITDSLTRSEFSKTIYNVNRTLTQTAEIFEQINSGKGSLGQLLKNDTLYLNLQNSSKNLNRLLMDIKENPKKYVRYSLFDLGRTINVLDEKEWNKIKKKEEKRKLKEEKEKQKQLEKEQKQLEKEQEQQKKDSLEQQKNDSLKKNSGMNYFFKIQIKSSVSPIPLNSSEFKGLQNIEEYRADGRYKYCVGNENNFQNAMNLHKEVKTYFPDAFPIAVKGGKIVPVHKAAKEI